MLHDMGMMINRRRVYGGSNRPIKFADPAVKAICVEQWGGADGGTAAVNTRVNNVKVPGVPGEMTYKQAASITTLPYRTFYNNDDIVLLDDLKYFINLSSIAGEAVSKLKNLLSITLPPSIISFVQHYAFYSLKTQRDLHITNLESFCKSNFSQNTSTPVSPQGHIYLNRIELTQVTIPNNVTSIKGTFYNAKFITQVILHNGITSIGDRTFMHSGITSIDIPDSVTSIGYSAFFGCSSLVSITLGSGLTSFGNEHRYMKSLERITSKAMVAPTLGGTPFLGVKQGGTLYVPKGSTGYDTLWMSGTYSLGAANWTMVEIDM